MLRIGRLLKRLHSSYNRKLLYGLRCKGFTDIRPSFLEILTYICEHEGALIKAIGEGCGLKKQTTRGHVNELIKRGHLLRRTSELDKREQKIFLTHLGEKFKFSLSESIFEVEKSYCDKMGEVELDRIEHVLTGFYKNLDYDYPGNDSHPRPYRRQG